MEHIGIIVFNDFKGSSEIRSDVKLIEILCLMLRAASYGKNQT